MKHACLICGDKQHRFLFSVKDFFSLHRYAVAECQSCAFVETVIPEIPETQKNIYGTAGRRFGKLQWLSKRLYAFRTRTVKKLKPGNLIDVGSGHGDFLEVMEQKGWRGQGVETEDESDFLSGRFENSADLITFWHSLEHLEHPKEYLNAAYTALKAGGTLLIEVPNFQSFQSWWSESRWLHLDCPRHRYHFSIEALKRIVTEAGFETRSISTFSWDVGLLGNLQAWLDHFGKTHFLYHFIQPERRKQMKGLGVVWNVFVTAVLLPLLMPLALVSEGVACLFRRGGVIRLTGVKA